MYRHIYHSFDCLFTALEKWMAPLWFLAMRLWLAQVFLKSGLVSISDWKRNVQLFKYEFKVPVIPPEVAAFFSTSVELVCPFLLILGLGTRVGALGILVTSLVIELTYDHNVNHLLWIVISTTLLLKGGGILSVDTWIGCKMKNCTLEKKCSQS